MSLWAIVPVKPLHCGKSRLSEILSEEERVELNKQSFADTIEILKQVDMITDILVVSRDSDVLTAAREMGVRTVTENGTPELNNALRRASLFSKAFSTEGILIVPADLRLLTPEDVREFLKARTEGPTIVIAPDRRHQGTNMLFSNPADLLTFSFGQDSFHKHTLLAESKGVKVVVVENERIALDLDTPEDYELLKLREPVSVLL